MKIEIWSVGKENESYVNMAVQNYFARIKPYCAIDLVTLQVPKKLLSTDTERMKLIEEALILKRLHNQHHLILLDERGKMQDSIQWSRQIQNCMNTGVKTLVFLIGGAFGVTPAVKARAAQTWSLSPLVFPHQLVRVILAEQIYRSYSILHNLPYHHE